jgi:hypothetical protein
VLITLLTNHIWPTLTAAVKTSPRPAVAVAYFGQGAAKLLPLPHGSHIVVDASDGAVKSGQTCPAELIKLLKRGVRVYSRKNLHAKIFVLGTKLFVGSANVSQHSAHALREAMVVTTDRSAVAAARTFIRELCVQEIGPEMLSHLAKLYRPPRLLGAGGRQVLAGRSCKRRPRFLITQSSVLEIAPELTGHGLPLSTENRERGRCRVQKNTQPLPNACHGAG